MIIKSKQANPDIAFNYLFGENIFAFLDFSLHNVPFRMTVIYLFRVRND